MAEERTSARRRSCTGVILFALIVGFWIGAGFDRQFRPNHIVMQVEAYSDVSLAPQVDDTIDWLDADGNSKTVWFETDSPCLVDGNNGGLGNNKGHISTCDVGTGNGSYEYHCDTPGCDPVLDPTSTTGVGILGKGNKPSPLMAELRLDLLAPINDSEIMLRDLRRISAAKRKPDTLSAATAAPTSAVVPPLVMTCGSGPVNVNPNTYAVPAGATVLGWVGGSLSFTIDKTSACTDTLPISSVSGQALCHLQTSGLAGKNISYTVTVNSPPAGCTQPSQTFNLQF